MAPEPSLSPERLRALVARVAGFYVSDRALRRAQQRMAGLLQAGVDIPPREVEAYLGAVRRYFDGFEREARVHLADIERRLARVSQLQFNLAAERGVTARRVETTQGVLANVAELAGP